MSRGRSSVLEVYVTFSSQREAEQISRTAVKEGLAACVNTWPVNSTYRWRGKQVRDREVAGLFKTTAGAYPRLERRIRQLHSDTVPSIVAWPITRGAVSYLSWVQGSVA